MDATNTETLADAIDRAEARKAQGPWFPACGGTEKPFRTRGGVLVLYMFQPSTGRHAYLDVEADIFLTDAEACRLLG